MDTNQQPTPAAPAATGAGGGGALALAIVGIVLPIVAPFAAYVAWRARGTGTATAALVLGLLGSLWLVVIVVSFAVNGVGFHTS